VMSVSSVHAIMAAGSDDVIGFATWRHEFQDGL
jgi:hypothetical protein